ncbi:MAG: hypothetical protein LBN34_01195 [Clostridiales Family XIII bacterium]|nr:hypothetical protein [Clostridiales Family XIII bacterium]
MNTILKGSFSRVLAIVLTLAVVLGTIQLNTLLPVRAAEVTDYSIQVLNGTDPVVDATVKLTSEADSSDEQTIQTDASGNAEFPSVDDSTMYSVEISGVSGYKQTGDIEVVPTTTPYVVDVTSHTSFTAVYEVTVDFLGSGDVSGSSEIEAGKIQAIAGSSPYFTATANTGYHVASVVIDGTAQTDGAFDNARLIYLKTFENIDRNHTVTVTFAINTYDITIGSVGSNGNVKYNDSSVSNQNIVANYGTEPELVISANSGYTFTVSVDNVTDSDYTKISSNSGGVTYKFGPISAGKAFDVTFEQIDSLSAEGQYILTYTKGGPIKTDISDTTTTVFLPNDAVANLAPIDKDGIKYKGTTYANPESISSTSLIDSSNPIFIADSWNFLSLILWKNDTKLTLDKALHIVIDKDKPVLSPITEPAWSDRAVTISGNVTDTDTETDPSSGLDRVVWSRDSELSVEQVLAENVKTSQITAGGSYSFVSDNDEHNDETYYVYAVDKANNVSVAETVKVKIDTRNPTIEKFKITKLSDGDDLSLLYNYLNFGTFFNEQVKITVTAADDPASSGLDTITLYVGGTATEDSPKLVDNSGKAEFILPKAFADPDVWSAANISAVATDKVGNITGKDASKPEGTPVFADESNSDIKANGLMIENVKPTLSVDYENPRYKENSGLPTQKDWYYGDIEFTIKTQDVNSGLRSVEVTINENSITKDKGEKPIDTKYYELSAKTVTEEAFVVKTDIAYDNGLVDGKYILLVKVTDNAGNVQTATKTIYIDRKNPYVTGFEFVGTGTSEKDGLPTVQLTDYGFYFRDTTTVIVSVSDDDPSSGLEAINYYTVDIHNGFDGTLRSAAVNEDGKASFQIPADFKGQIYAKGVDNVLHGGEYVQPDGAVVESPEKHAVESSITFDKAKTSFKDISGLDLYASDTAVTINVSDTYSGLKAVEWLVSGPSDEENNQSGSVEIDNNKSFVEGGDTDWTQTKTDKNLVTEMKKTITVKNNSNDIKVWVKITDRAGNTSEKTLSFSIDKTKPTVEISYDNNTPDSTYTDYYNDTRTATVKVTERNFDSSKAYLDRLIGNADYSFVPSFGDAGLAIPAGIKNGSVLATDEDSYTFTVAFASDGNYNFDLKYKDLASNAATSEIHDKFIVDLTDPVAAISYDNNNARTIEGADYYKAGRLATVTVTEHNFDPARVDFTGIIAQHDGAVDASRLPALPSAWSSNGDVHTATINFNDVDAHYDVDVNVTDKSGRTDNEDNTATFYVDQEAPKIAFVGDVQDSTAFRAEVRPVIDFTDTNLYISDVSIYLSAANGGSVGTLKGAGSVIGSFSGSYASGHNQETFTFNDFPESTDDVYTLHGTITDKAGNEFDDSIVFSVNRDGSNYILDDAAKSIIDYGYTNKTAPVTVKEINASNIVSSSITHSKAGSPKALSSGSDYTVAAKGGNPAAWSEVDYTVTAANFKYEVDHNLRFESTDTAGNDNSSERKIGKLNFIYDVTAPDVAVNDFKAVNAEPVKITATISDDRKLHDKDAFTIRLYSGKGDNSGTILKEGDYTIDEVDSNNMEVVVSFTVPEGNNQYFTIEAQDKATNSNADNIYDSRYSHGSSAEFLVVNDNPIARAFYSNTPLFFGVIGGILLLLIAAAAWFIISRRRREVEEAIESI